MPLNAKQALFVREYLVDLNATQAAIRAGYSAKTAGVQGHDLLKKPEIQQAIAAAQQARSRRTEITADYVLTNLQEVLERCMQRSPVMVREGREMTQLVDDEGRHVWEFNANGANKSLELMGKHLAMWVDRHEVKADGSFAEQLRLARERAQKVSGGAGTTAAVAASQSKGDDDASLGPDGGDS